MRGSQDVKYCSWFSRLPACVDHSLTVAVLTTSHDALLSLLLRRLFAERRPLLRCLQAPFPHQVHQLEEPGLELGRTTEERLALHLLSQEPDQARPLRRGRHERRHPPAQRRPQILSLLDQELRAEDAEREEDELQLDFHPGRYVEVLGSTQALCRLPLRPQHAVGQRQRQVPENYR